MRVFLTRKLAGKFKGVNLEGYQVGDVLDLPTPQARLLIAEGWAAAELPADAPGRSDALQQASQF